MADLTAQAHARLGRQAGVASVADLIDAGMTRWSIDDVIRRGGLIRVLPGAYRSASVQETELVRCVAVSRARLDTVVCGPTAARLLGIRRVRHDRVVHVLAPPASNPTTTSWVVPFRTASWTDADVEEQPNGIRVLRHPRLALDLARFVNGIDLLSIVEQCMHDGKVDHEEMQRVAVDWLTHGRPWVKRYLDTLERRIIGPAAESHAEAVVGDRLVAAGVRGLVRQHWLELPGHRRIRFDLAIPRLRWALEIDGYPTHRETNGARADRQRDAAARTIGWRVRRLRPADLGRRLDTTIESVRAEVAGREAAARSAR